MAKTILITGGAGFVGSHLADALLAAGHHVRIFDNLTGQVHRDGIPEYLADGAEFIQGDVRDSAAMRRALAGVEIVFHMAAAVGVGQSMYEIEHYMGTNTQGTAVLLQQLLDSKSRVEKLVLASSMSIYGEANIFVRSAAAWRRSSAPGTNSGSSSGSQIVPHAVRRLRPSLQMNPSRSSAALFMHSPKKTRKRCPCSLAGPTAFR